MANGIETKLREASTLPTLLTARGLAKVAGVSPQVVESRMQSGDLVPVAVISSGGFLYTHDQALMLRTHI